MATTSHIWGVSAHYKWCDFQLFDTHTHIHKFTQIPPPFAATKIFHGFCCNICCVTSLLSCSWRISHRETTIYSSYITIKIAFNWFTLIDKYKHLSMENISAPQVSEASPLDRGDLETGWDGRWSVVVTSDGNSQEKNKKRNFLVIISLWHFGKLFTQQHLNCPDGLFDWGVPFCLMTAGIGSKPRRTDGRMDGW